MNTFDLLIDIYYLLIIFSTLQALNTQSMHRFLRPRKPRLSRSQGLNVNGLVQKKCIPGSLSLQTSLSRPPFAHRDAKNPQVQKWTYIVPIHGVVKTYAGWMFKKLTHRR